MNIENRGRISMLEANGLLVYSAADTLTGLCIAGEMP